ncbi:MAG: signal peptidase II [Roseburia sp.]|nr:signal peptidase II [Roseburia sp.]
MSKGNGSFKNKVAAVWAFIKNIAARVWRYLKVAKMEYIVMISLFAADLISKAIVNATVDVNSSVVLIPKFLNIHNLHNYNAVFGSSFMTNLLGSIGTRIFFGVFAVAASVVFVLVLIKSKGGNKLFRVALAMLVAGAMGNCIDRMFLGYVRDFVEFEYFGLEIFGSKSFYVFNIADAELVIGVILVAIYFIFIYHDKDSSTSTEEKSASDGEADVAIATADGEQAAANSDAVTDGEQTDEPSADGNETEVSDAAENTADGDNVAENTADAGSAVAENTDDGGSDIASDIDGDEDTSA